jgi:quercetin dioxygenase-like cupin family protein
VPIYRFEQFERKQLTPHLSSGEGPVIEGRYMYFCKVHKEAGAGSELHYHPNELLIFPLEGKINALVGKDRRIVPPGTFVHIPPFALHSMKATEEGPMNYLYIKDRTWTVVGVAADEAPPERAPTVEEVTQAHRSGRWPGQRKEPEKAQGRSEGLGNCYYPILESLAAPPRSGRWFTWIEGERLAFGFFELPPGHREQARRCDGEQFLYVISGAMEVWMAGESRTAGPGDIVHVPRGAEAEVSVIGAGPVRHAAVRSLPSLQATLGG